MVIGFPQQSYISGITRIKMLQLNESTNITAPNISFGFMDNFKKNQYWFEGKNIYTNHGNSGGAIVNLKNGKLVGIDSRFPPVLHTSTSSRYYTTTQIVFIKASIFLNLIKSISYYYLRKSGRRLIF